jgi:hypothetical protein
MSPLHSGLVDLKIAESDAALLECMRKWNIHDNFVRQRLRLERARLEWPLPSRSELTVAQHTALLFLHLKNLGSDLDDEERPLRFKVLVLGPQRARYVGNDVGYTRALGAHKRLLNLVTWSEDLTWDGVGTPPEPLAGFQTWASFLAGAGKVWSEAGSFLCFREDTVKQRAQIHGTCFMQAPNVLVHYLVCKYLGRAPLDEATMVDLTKAKLRHVEALDLWKFIVDDSGGYAEDFLRELCDDRCLALHHLTHSQLTDTSIVKALDTWGPGLISSVVVKSDEILQDPLYQPDVGELLGASDASVAVVKDNLRHAMLIVGHRTHTVTRMGRCGSWCRTGGSASSSSSATRVSWWGGLPCWRG